MPRSASRPGKKVTLAEIAEHSGVSSATVSLVLRDKPGIGEETRQKVIESARELGYIYEPSNQSKDRSLPTGIGLILKSRPNDLPAANSFYIPVMSGIETISRKNGINLMYENLPVDRGNNPLEPPRLLIDQEVEGLLLVGMHLSGAILSELISLDIPIVLVDGYADGDPFDSVVTNNYSGAYQATRELIEHGHTRIAIIGSLPRSYPSIQARREGYLGALKEHALSPIYADCYLHPEAVPPTVETLLDKHPETTAVFACNDEVAIRTMQSAQELGRRIPDDLSVIGFDNIELSQHIFPRLTTMRVDKMGMGRLAAQLLLNRIEFPEGGLVRTIIYPSLVRRDTVRSLTAG
ncbi:MAG: LacI family DNA-binding transcriptional regulator [Anaerolineae bacterium]|nr:LacI family DNA-binding transcriptional regulator [Anaerolineae bacterium]